MDITTNKLLQVAAGSKDTSWSAENVNMNQEPRPMINMQNYRSPNGSMNSDLQGIQWMSDTEIAVGGYDHSWQVFHRMTTAGDLSTMEAYAPHGGSVNGVNFYPYPAAWYWYDNYWADNGTKLFIAPNLVNSNWARGTLERYDCTTAYDASTATLAQSHTISTWNTNNLLKSMVWHPDGTKIWCFSSMGDVVEVRMGTAYDLSSVVSYVAYNYNSAFPFNQFTDTNTRVKSMCWADNGNKLYVTGWNSSVTDYPTTLLYFTTTLPYVMNPLYMTLQAEIKKGDQKPYLAGKSNTNGEQFFEAVSHVHVTSDGTTMYWWAAEYGRQIYKGIMTTPYDPTTLQVQSPDTMGYIDRWNAGYWGAGKNLEISEDESKIFAPGAPTTYMTGAAQNEPTCMYTYTMTTPGDVTTITRPAYNTTTDRVNFNAVSGVPQVNGQNIFDGNYNIKTLVLNKKEITLGGVVRPKGTVLWVITNGPYDSSHGNYKSHTWTFTSTTPYVWNNSTVSYYNYHSFDVQAIAAGVPSGSAHYLNNITWNADGTKCVISYYSFGIECDVTTAYDITTTSSTTYHSTIFNAFGYIGLQQRFDPDLTVSLSFEGYGSNYGWNSNTLTNPGDVPIVMGDYITNSYTPEYQTDLQGHDTYCFWTEDQINAKLDWVINHEGTAVYTFPGSNHQESGRIFNVNKISLV